MIKTVTKWILVSFGVGMIPVILLAASQGGIALSPIILLISLVIGAIGAAVHVNIEAQVTGTRKQKFQASLFAVITATFIVLLVYNAAGCELQKEYAIERAREHVRSQSELDIKYLGDAMFDEGSCVCIFEYYSPTRNFTIYVSDHGKLHSSQH